METSVIGLALVFFGPPLLWGMLALWGPRHRSISNLGLGVMRALICLGTAAMFAAASWDLGETAVVILFGVASVCSLGALTLCGVFSPQ